MIETKRKELGEPFRKKILDINDLAKKLTEPLDQVIELANLKANQYVKYLDEQRVSREKELQEEAALFDTQLEVYIPETPKVIHGEAASVCTKKEIRYRILDQDDIPKKYWVVDHKAIEFDLSMGITKIPGLEVYEEKTTTLRKK
jgi:hypothetical protein